MDKNQTIAVELNNSDRLKLDCQIRERLKLLGYESENVLDLKLGCELAEGWPLTGPVTLAELTIVAYKLKMQIVISNLDMVCRK